MIKELEDFLNKAIICDLTDESAEKFKQIINTHIFIVGDVPADIWMKYICQTCKFDLDYICWTDRDVWDTKNCQECQIKRLLE